MFQARLPFSLHLTVTQMELLMNFQGLQVSAAGGVLPSVTPEKATHHEEARSRYPIL